MAHSTTAPPPSGTSPAVGFRRVSLTSEDGLLDVGIWYPTSDTPRLLQILSAKQMVAEDGVVVGDSLPLVLMSHGSGAWFGAHHDTACALASAGFVVAAVTHPGDHTADRSKAARIWERPLSLVAVLDYLLEDWSQRRRINADRVGVFGFSFGAFTALVLVGGKPDMTRVISHCQRNPDEAACRMLANSTVDTKGLKMPSRDGWIQDVRISAAVLAAPALGYAFGPDGLKGVTAPVQIWRAENDDVLTAYHAEALRDDLPRKPDYRVSSNARHLSFQAPDSPGGDAPGLDLKLMHVGFNREVVRFFRRTLLQQEDPEAVVTNESPQVTRLLRGFRMMRG